LELFFWILTFTVMASETASSVDELAVSSVAAEGPDTRGKHRILAQLKRVEQESRFLEVSFFFFSINICACVFGMNWV
jgi:hypothetical protein